MKISTLVSTFFGVCAVIVATGVFPLKAVTFEEYEAAVKENIEVNIKGINLGDKKNLTARLYKPSGDGPFPAIIALHGAGGIFPYQLWWAKKVSQKQFVVLFIDSYCSRGLLCTHHTDDTDPKRGHIMRSWDKVSIKQRMLDAGAGYKFLSSKGYVDKNLIGLIGWSWGGTTALFAQKFSERLKLPNGGFKGTIAFYPNLKHVIEQRNWKNSGKIKQPTLILYGKRDKLESEESYKSLLNNNHSGPILVKGYDGAVRKFDELGGLRTKRHPRVGEFEKAFNKPAFENALTEVMNFLIKYFKR